ncbi:MAG: O-antigen ligase family protein [Desulfobulbaceae bacterium]|jgi:O-antigen ligase|nr:O-antigen ligase family protein [Desulfobulbaceae bacterium]
MIISQNRRESARFRDFFARLGGAALICACFFLPLSVALLNLCALFMAVCWLLSGKPAAVLGIFRRSPSATLACALFALLAASLIYTTAPFGYGLEILAKYRKLLYLPIVFSLVSDAPTLRRKAVDAFMGGCAVLLLVSYFKLITVLLGTAIFVDRHGFSLVYHITHSFFMAMFIFFLVERAMAAATTRKQRRAYIAVALLAGFNLFSITPGRTGWMICLALLAFSFLRRCSWRRMTVGALLVAALAALTWQSSSIVSVRVREIVKETRRYQPGQSRTSMGMRYDWWHNAVTLFAESPWLGKGVGSFPGEQKRLVAALGQRTQATDNPHNDYLFFAEQTGVCGLALFLALLVAPTIEGRRRPIEGRRLLEGVALAMALGCLANSLLFDSHQGHFYILMTGLLLAEDSENLT